MSIDVCTGQVNDSALVTRIRSRPQRRHCPGWNSVISLCTGQVQTSASRTFSRVIPHNGQLPGSLSTTSGCIGQLHESGGSGASAGFCWNADTRRAEREDRERAGEGQEEGAAVHASRGPGRSAYDRP